MKTKLLLLFCLLVIVVAVSLSACDDDDDDNDDATPADDDTADDDTTDDDTTDDDDTADDDTTNNIIDDDTTDDDTTDDDTTDDDTSIEDYGALIPGPDEAGFDADLETKALRYAQQFNGIMTVPLGMSLEAYITDNGMRDLVDDWLTNSEVDEGFEEYTGTAVYDAVAAYGEFGDLGMFGGMASLGDAFRYALARDDRRVDRATVAQLRDNVEHLMETLYICVAITGDQGTVVRGLRPIDIPNDVPTLTPLFDVYGNPLPVDKEPVWRADNSEDGEFPDYIWEDDTSKDQLDGFVLAMGVVWDVVADDSEIDQDLKEKLQWAAAHIGDKLMEVAPETGLYLTIRDADGRLTTYHDLHPLELEGVMLPPIAGNGFNAVMALGVFKTIAMITGEQRFKDFFYELIDQKNFLKYVDQTFRFSVIGPFTNWSNVNMAYCAIYPLLRYEADTELFAYWQRVLQRDLWTSYWPGWGVDKAGQGYFNLIHAAFSRGGTDEAAADDAAEDLAGFPDPPYWNSPAIINCDEDEIAAGECLAVDGETVIQLAGVWWGGEFHYFPGHTGDPQATQPMPRHVRPPSNFNWRSSPYEINGGGGSRMNPGGDFHGAYWLGRYMKRSNNSRINVSPNAW